MTTYRAAYWQSDDARDKVVLTLPDHADLTDQELMRLARVELQRLDTMSRGRLGRIILGEWTE